MHNRGAVFGKAMYTLPCPSAALTSSTESAWRGRERRRSCILSFLLLSMMVHWKLLWVLRIFI